MALMKRKLSSDIADETHKNKNAIYSCNVKDNEPILTVQRTINDLVEDDENIKQEIVDDIYIKFDETINHLEEFLDQKPDLLSDEISDRSSAENKYISNEPQNCSTQINEAYNLNSNAKKIFMKLIEKIPRTEICSIKYWIWQSAVHKLKLNDYTVILEEFNLLNGNPSIEGLMRSHLKNFLCFWVGWMKIEKETNDKTILDICHSLYTYIKERFQEEIDNSDYYNDSHKQCNINDAIYISCPFRVLKGIFNDNPHESGICSFAPKNENVKIIHRLFLVKNMNNWPFISVKLAIPGLEFWHCNYHHSDFKIVNMKFHHKPNITEPMDTNLYFKPSDQLRKINSSTISNYIMRFIKYIQTSKWLRTEKPLILFLNEFKKNLDLANEHIVFGCEYYVNLFRYPYVRYFSSTEEILRQSFNIIPPVNDKSLNIRLQQTSYPIIKFSVNEFKFVDDDNQWANFLEQESFIKDNCNYLLYKCELCNKSFNTASSTRSISTHMRAHGLEPDWLCSKCEKSFSANSLSALRWNHDCITNENK